VVLIVVAAGIGNEIMALLIGQSADPETVEAIRRFVETQQGVDTAVRVLTLQLGTSLMVSLKLKLKAVTAGELISRINEIEVALRIEFPEIQWLFVEPDVADKNVSTAAKAACMWSSSVPTPGPPCRKCVRRSASRRPERVSSIFISRTTSVPSSRTRIATRRSANTSRTLPSWRRTSVLAKQRESMKNRSMP